VRVHPDRLLADGYDSALVSIQGSAGQPRIVLVRKPYGTSLEGARIRSGVIPGRIALRVEFAGAPPATLELTSVLDTRDRDEDGTPDFLRLDTSKGIAARFAAGSPILPSCSISSHPRDRVPEINDCAALIRYAYREALRVHDTAWAQEAKLAVVPAFGLPRKSTTTRTRRLTAGLFRVRPGPFQAADSVGRGRISAVRRRQDFAALQHARSSAAELAGAQPGDLLFFRQQTSHVTYHGMIYLGAPARCNPDGRSYVSVSYRPG
jgi:uncharacterized protein YfaT (DUF1175 family)